jgi:hypothetical protein
MATLETTPTPKQTPLDTDSDWELERQEIWRTLNEACRPLATRRMRIALGMAILAELLDEPRVPAKPILECIARAEAVVYLHRYPPVGGAA